MSCLILASFMMCCTTLPCMVRSRFAPPVSRGFSATRENSKIRREKQVPCRYMGGGLPRGMPRHLRSSEVVPPKTRRKTQISRVVAWMSWIFCFWPHHVPSWRHKTKAMPPRRPACHIMNMCLGEIMRRFSFSSFFPTCALMMLQTPAKGKVARALPSRQNSMTKQPSLKPSGREREIASPTKRKTAMSASDESCFSRNEHNREPSTDRWFGTKELMTMPQKRMQMMPDNFILCCETW
mmetsp:Transcript_12689/g.35072  ORF Transcript_12689/g.35072 Transcript_12689/m.35072 type:complete len:238 (-) Transcript_12689:1000-1713(-)